MPDGLRETIEKGIKSLEKKPEGYKAPTFGVEIQKGGKQIHDAELEKMVVHAVVDKKKSDAGDTG